MNTNLIAVSDVFVERAQEEVAKLSVLVFVSLIIFAVLAAILIAFLVRKSLAPLFQINEAASQIRTVISITRSIISSRMR